MVDCDKCGKPDAISRCGKCISVFYCSKECQASDWPIHKPKCTMLSYVLEQTKIKNEGIENLTNKLADESNICCVCLDNPSSAINFSCDHFVCFPCFQKMLTTNLLRTSIIVTCPLCRRQDDVLSIFNQSRYDAISRLGTIGDCYPEGSPERIKYHKAMVSNLELMQPFTPNELTANKLKIEIMTYSGDFSGAVAYADSLLATEENIEQKSRILLLKGIAEFRNKNYSEAMRSLDAAQRGMDKNNPKSNVVIHRCYDLATACLFECGFYDKAISTGESVLRSSRCLAVYKYIALSHESLGNINAAISVMKRAVAYLPSLLNDQLTQESKDHLHRLQTLASSASSPGAFSSSS